MFIIKHLINLEWHLSFYLNNVFDFTKRLGR